LLGSSKVVAFAPTRDAKKARAFYEGVLGLKLVSKDKFALVFDANGTMLRVASVPPYKPHQFTILGWDVDDIDAAVKKLSAKGVELQQYGMPGQDKRGIWTAPSGARVAWFKDPDGNVLSLTEFEIAGRKTKG
jgi:catechol 2,3-dioxygenase-like lactoylglutathione lyase family enzyme